MSNDGKVVVRGSDAGFALWLMGWLFTLGLLHLHVPKAIWALVLWPYYLGEHLAK